MIAALMLYSLAVTLLFAVAAVAADQVLRLLRLPARLMWIAAMLGAIAVSAIRFQSGLTTPTTPDVTESRQAPRSQAVGLASSASSVPVAVRSPILERVSMPAIAGRIRIVTGSPVTLLDRPLVAFWIALSSIGLAMIVLSAMRLARPRPTWTTTTVDGVPILVSHDVGPAVIGVMRYRIVLPAWALGLSAAERELILAHEREHATAGDPSLLFLATLLLALTPWNLPLWWMARRLRFAIELDCDARVLRQRPDCAAYGSLLIDVSERTLGGAIPIAALAEPVSLVERRIRAMTARLPRFAVVRGIAASLIAATLVIVACAGPHPEGAPAPTPMPTALPTPPVAAEPPVGSPAPRPLDPIRIPDTTGFGRSVARFDSATRLVAIELDTLRAHLAMIDSIGLVDRQWRWRMADTTGFGLGVARLDTTGFGRSAARLDTTARLAAIQLDTIRAHLARIDSGGLVDAQRLVWTNPRYVYESRVVAQVMDTAKQRYPAAFAEPRNEFDFIVLAFDSTGAVVRAGIKSHAPLAARERISDRDVLRVVMPGVSIESFKEWGLVNVRQSEGRGVMVLYAFTGRAPW